MKILICTGIYPPDFGGPATYSKLLFEELPKRGIETEVLSFGEVRKLPKLRRHFAYFLKVLKQGKNVDLIYAQDPVSVGLSSLLAAKFLRKKFVLKMVGDYAWEQFQQNQKSKSKNQKDEFITPEDFQNRKFDFVTEVRRKVERFVGKRSDKIIVPSEYLKRIVMMWGIKAEKITVIYNTFAPKEVEETKEELKKFFGFDYNVIFSAGRLVPWKGFETLIDAVKDLPDVKLFIAGDGPDKDRLEIKIERLDLVEKVILLGRLEQEDLLKFIKASDVFVLNTGYEGLSHQLLEVMAIGTPIVTTKVGGNFETVENGKEGLLIEYNNKEQIKQAVNKILNDSGMRRMFAENAKEKIKEFSREKMLNKTVETLTNLI